MHRRGHQDRRGQHRGVRARRGFRGKLPLARERERHPVRARGVCCDRRFIRHAESDLELLDVRVAPVHRHGLQIIGIHRRDERPDVRQYGAGRLRHVCARAARQITGGHRRHHARTIIPACIRAHDQ